MLRRGRLPGTLSENCSFFFFLEYLFKFHHDLALGTSALQVLYFSSSLSACGSYKS